MKFAKQNSDTISLSRSYAKYLKKALGSSCLMDGVAPGHLNQFKTGIMDTENKDLQGQDKDLQKESDARKDQENLKKDVSLPKQEETEKQEDEEPKERKKSYFDRFMDIGGNSGGSSI